MFMNRIACGLIVLCSQVPTLAADAKVKSMNSPPAASKHYKSLKEQVDAVYGAYERAISGDCSDTEKEEALRNAESEMKRIRGQFIDKRKKEYMAERKLLSKRLHVKAGRAGVFEGRDWSSTQAIVSLNGQEWQYEPKRLKLNAKTQWGTIGKTVRHLPNGVLIKVRAREASFTNPKRGSSVFDGTVVVSFRRSAQAAIIAAQDDLQELQKKLEKEQ